MVHLAPLPGAPRHTGSMDQVIDAALRDTAVLAAAGFDALMIENFGDAPFFADDVPDVTVAAMTRAVTEIRSVTSLPIGVNVLRNDGLAAAAIAIATGASLIRVNVLTGTMYTDQGPIVGQAAEIARTLMTAPLPPLVLADVFVKHATPPPGLTVEQAALDTWERGGASALVVSGTGTGTEIDIEDARRIRRAVPHAPLVVGSGASVAGIEQLAGVVDSIIVGTSLKAGDVSSPVDPGLAETFISAARAAGFTP
ncbi:MAG TPA: BtpA/SgcQ family protein [Acidimicrobiia bacterium]